METPNQRFKEIREKRNLTQTKFGKYIDLSDNQVKMIENNKQKVTLDVALKINKVFGEDWQWILTGERGSEILKDKDIQEVLDLYIKARSGDVESGKMLEQRIFGLVAAVRQNKDKL